MSSPASSPDLADADAASKPASVTEPILTLSLPSVIGAINAMQTPVKSASTSNRPQSRSRGHYSAWFSPKSVDASVASSSSIPISSSHSFGEFTANQSQNHTRQPVPAAEATGPALAETTSTTVPSIVPPLLSAVSPRSRPNSLPPLRSLTNSSSTAIMDTSTPVADNLKVPSTSARVEEKQNSEEEFQQQLYFALVSHSESEDIVNSSSDRDAKFNADLEELQALLTTSTTSKGELFASSVRSKENVIDYQPMLRAPPIWQRDALPIPAECTISHHQFANDKDAEAQSAVELAEEKESARLYLGVNNIGIDAAYYQFPIDPALVAMSSSPKMDSASASNAMRGMFPISDAKRLRQARNHFRASIQRYHSTTMNELGKHSLWDPMVQELHSTERKPEELHPALQDSLKSRPAYVAPPALRFGDEPEETEEQDARHWLEDEIMGAQTVIQQLAYNFPNQVKVLRKESDEMFQNEWKIAHRMRMIFQHAKCDENSPFGALYASLRAEASTREMMTACGGEGPSALFFAWFVSEAQTQTIEARRYAAQLLLRILMSPVKVTEAENSDSADKQRPVVDKSPDQLHALMSIGASPYVFTSENMLPHELCGWGYRNDLKDPDTKREVRSTLDKLRFKVPKWLTVAEVKKGFVDVDSFVPKEIQVATRVLDHGEQNVFSVIVPMKEPAGCRKILQLLQTRLPGTPHYWLWERLVPAASSSSSISLASSDSSEGKLIEMGVDCMKSLHAFFSSFYDSTVKNWSTDAAPLLFNGPSRNNVEANEPIERSHLVLLNHQALQMCSEYDVGPSLDDAKRLAANIPMTDLSKSLKDIRTQLRYSKLGRMSAEDIQLEIASETTLKRSNVLGSLSSVQLAALKGLLLHGGAIHAADRSVSTLVNLILLSIGRHENLASSWPTIFQAFAWHLATEGQPIGTQASSTSLSENGTGKEDGKGELLTLPQLSFELLDLFGKNCDIWYPFREYDARASVAYAVFGSSLLSRWFVPEESWSVLERTLPIAEIDAGGNVAYMQRGVLQLLQRANAQSASALTKSHARMVLPLVPKIFKKLLGVTQLQLSEAIQLSLSFEFEAVKSEFLLATESFPNKMLSKALLERYIKKYGVLVKLLEDAEEKSTHAATTLEKNIVLEIFVFFLPYLLHQPSIRWVADHPGKWKDVQRDLKEYCMRFYTDDSQQFSHYAYKDETLIDTARSMVRPLLERCWRLAKLQEIRHHKLEARSAAIDRGEAVPDLVAPITWRNKSPYYTLDSELGHKGSPLQVEVVLWDWLKPKLVALGVGVASESDAHGLMLADESYDVGISVDLTDHECLLLEMIFHVLVKFSLSGPLINGRLENPRHSIWRRQLLRKAAVASNLTLRLWAVQCMYEVSEQYEAPADIARFKAYTQSAKRLLLDEQCRFPTELADIIIQYAFPPSKPLLLEFTPFLLSCLESEHPLVRQNALSSIQLKTADEYADGNLSWLWQSCFPHILTVCEKEVERLYAYTEKHGEETPAEIEKVAKQNHWTLSGIPLKAATRPTTDMRQRLLQRLALPVKKGGLTADFLHPYNGRLQALQWSFPTMEVAQSALDGAHGESILFDADKMSLIEKFLYPKSKWAAMEQGISKCAKYCRAEQKRMIYIPEELQEVDASYEVDEQKAESEVAEDGDIDSDQDADDLYDRLMADTIPKLEIVGARLVQLYDAAMLRAIETKTTLVFPEVTTRLVNRIIQMFGKSLQVVLYWCCTHERRLMYADDDRSGENHNMQRFIESTRSFCNTVKKHQHSSLLFQPLSMPESALQSVWRVFIIIFATHEDPDIRITAIKWIHACALHSYLTRQMLITQFELISPAMTRYDLLTATIPYSNDEPLAMYVMALQVLVNSYLLVERESKTNKQLLSVDETICVQEGVVEACAMLRQGLSMLQSPKQLNDLSCMDTVWKAEGSEWDSWQLAYAHALIVFQSLSPTSFEDVADQVQLFVLSCLHHGVVTIAAEAAQSSEQQEANREIDGPSVMCQQLPTLYVQLLPMYARWMLLLKDQPAIVQQLASPQAILLLEAIGKFLDDQVDAREGRVIWAELIAMVKSLSKPSESSAIEAQPATLQQDMNGTATVVEQESGASQTSAAPPSLKHAGTPVEVLAQLNKSLPQEVRQEELESLVALLQTHQAAIKEDDLQLKKKPLKSLNDAAAVSTITIMKTAFPLLSTKANLTSLLTSLLLLLRLQFNQAYDCRQQNALQDHDEVALFDPIQQQVIVFSMKYLMNLIRVVTFSMSPTTSSDKKPVYSEEEYESELEEQEDEKDALTSDAAEDEKDDSSKETGENESDTVKITIRSLTLNQHEHIAFLQRMQLVLCLLSSIPQPVQISNLIAQAFQCLCQGAASRLFTPDWIKSYACAVPARDSLPLGVMGFCARTEVSWIVNDEDDASNSGNDSGIQTTWLVSASEQRFRILLHAWKTMFGRVNGIAIDGVNQSDEALFTILSYFIATVTPQLLPEAAMQVASTDSAVTPAISIIAKRFVNDDNSVQQYFQFVFAQITTHNNLLDMHLSKDFALTNAQALLRLMFSQRCVESFQPKKYCKHTTSRSIIKAISVELDEAAVWKRELRIDPAVSPKYHMSEDTIGWFVRAMSYMPIAWPVDPTNVYKKADLEGVECIMLFHAHYLQYLVKVHHAELQQASTRCFEQYLSPEEIEIVRLKQQKAPPIPQDLKGTAAAKNKSSTVTVSLNDTRFPPVIPRLPQRIEHHPMHVHALELHLVRGQAVICDACGATVVEGSEVYQCVPCNIHFCTSSALLKWEVQLLAISRLIREFFVEVRGLVYPGPVFKELMNFWFLRREDAIASQLLSTLRDALVTDAGQAMTIISEAREQCVAIGCATHAEVGDNRDEVQTESRKCHTLFYRAVTSLYVCASCKMTFRDASSYTCPECVEHICLPCIRWSTESRFSVPNFLDQVWPRQVKTFHEQVNQTTLPSTTSTDTNHAIAGLKSPWETVKLSETPNSWASFQFPSITRRWDTDKIEFRCTSSQCLQGIVSDFVTRWTSTDINAELWNPHGAHGDVVYQWLTEVLDDCAQAKDSPDHPLPRWQKLYSGLALVRQLVLDVSGHELYRRLAPAIARVLGAALQSPVLVVRAYALQLLSVNLSGSHGVRKTLCQDDVPINEGVAMNLSSVNLQLRELAQALFKPKPWGFVTFLVNNALEPRLGKAVTVHLQCDHIAALSRSIHTLPFLLMFLSARENDPVSDGDFAILLAVLQQVREQCSSVISSHRHAHILSSIVKMIQTRLFVYYFSFIASVNDAKRSNRNPFDPEHKKDTAAETDALDKSNLSSLGVQLRRVQQWLTTISVPRAKIIDGAADAMLDKVLTQTAALDDFYQAMRFLYSSLHTLTVTTPQEGKQPGEVPIAAQPAQPEKRSADHNLQKQIDPTIKKAATDRKGDFLAKYLNSAMKSPCRFGLSCRNQLCSFTHPERKVTRDDAATVTEAIVNAATVVSECTPHLLRILRALLRSPLLTVSIVQPILPLIVDTLVRQASFMLRELETPFNDTPRTQINVDLDDITCHASNLSKWAIRRLVALLLHPTLSQQTRVLLLEEKHASTMRLFHQAFQSLVRDKYHHFSRLDHCLHFFIHFYLTHPTLQDSLASCVRKEDLGVPICNTSKVPLRYFHMLPTFTSFCMLTSVDSLTDSLSPSQFHSAVAHPAEALFASAARSIACLRIMKTWTYGVAVNDSECNKLDLLTILVQTPLYAIENTLNANKLQQSLHPRASDSSDDDVAGKTLSLFIAVLLQNLRRLRNLLQRESNPAISTQLVDNSSSLLLPLSLQRILTIIQRHRSQLRQVSESDTMNIERILREAVSLQQSSSSSL